MKGNVTKRHFSIISREARGNNVAIHYIVDGREGEITFDRYRSGRYEARANGLFYGILDIDDDALVVNALDYVL